VAGLCTCTVEVASGAEGRMGLVSRALSVVSVSLVLLGMDLFRAQK
jgi:hypothetical protein